MTQESEILKQFAPNDRVQYSAAAIARWNAQYSGIVNKTGTITRVYMLGRYPIARVMFDNECGPDDFPHEVAYENLEKIGVKEDTSDDWFNQF